MLRDLDWTHVLILVAAVAAVVYAFDAGEVSDSGSAEDGAIAEIRITGTIQPGDGFSRDGTTPQGVRQLVDEAGRADSDAYLFVINSGGGSVVASKDLARTVEDIEEPTACLMKDSAASGAYWMATACDTIVADSLTMTGSIGVTATYLEFSGLLNKLGIEYVNITSGELKDIGSPMRNLTAEEREILQEQLDTVHAAFVDQVAEGRNMSAEAVREYATGEPLLGQEAKEAGLVDTLGGREEAVSYLESEVGRNMSVEEYRGRSSLDLLTLLTMSMGEGIGHAMSGELSSVATGGRLLAE